MVGVGRRDEGRPGARDRRVECRHEERLPVLVGLRCRVAVAVRFADRGDRPPEGVVVFVVPAVDAGVCRRQVEHRKQAGRVGEVEPSARILCQPAGDPVPDRGGMAIHEHRDVGLLRRPLRALEGAELLDLVELLGVGGAGEVVRAVRAKLGRALEQEGKPGGEPGAGIAERTSIGREQRPPIAGIGAPHAGMNLASIMPLGEHRIGRGDPGRDPFSLAGPAGTSASDAS